MKQTNSLIILLCGLLFLAARIPALGATVAEINDKVEKIQKRIQVKNKDLPHLDVAYDYNDATEGVPPGFKFYFDAESQKLTACLIHVGHETWSHDFSYYFDEQENVLKYLDVIFGDENKSPRSAIIYGKDGKPLWKNVDAPRLEPAEIRTLYRALQKTSETISL